jgi:hypothetical protein
MNIFYLDHDVVKCAEMHNDKHCIKMILEYAQLLSTAHRVLDGVLTTDRGGANGRQRTSYILPDYRDDMLYRATHINHPSAIWVRQSATNYDWLFSLFQALMAEYTYRYGKTHKCSSLEMYLAVSPKNISRGPFTEPTPAMPDEVKVAGNSIKSYQNYYISNKQHLATWSGKINSRNKPEWFTNANI